MRRKTAMILTLALFLAVPATVSALPYVGLVQGQYATELEIGYLSRLSEQEISVGLPSVLAVDDWSSAFYAKPVASMTLLFRFRSIGWFVPAAGFAVRAGCDFGVPDRPWTVRAGISAHLSLERPETMDILFLEYTYLPDVLSMTVLRPGFLISDAVSQNFRIGWHHAF